jgi:ribosomal protein S18 acetylase RimI-like enzyme
MPLPTALYGPGLPPLAAAGPPVSVLSATAPPASAPQFAPAASPPMLMPAAAPAPAPPRRAGPRYGPPAHVSSGIEVRRLRSHDLPAIPHLANADLLPGQPACNMQLVDLALRGESPVDSQWWKELASIQAIVATRDGNVVGAASYAVAPADGSGWLLWLHAREEQEVVEMLADRVLRELNGCSHIYAFWIATALTLGVEALPAMQRPVTRAVLEARGMVGRDTWRYLVAPLEGPGVTPEEIAEVAQVSGPGEIPAWRLTVGTPDKPVAVAEIALGREGCGVLWWIDVDPAQRGRGIGRSLLKQAMRFLALRGARTLAAFVDHDDPRERDRRPAIRLLESMGFEEFDHLWAFESQRRRH